MNVPAAVIAVVRSLVQAGVAKLMSVGFVIAFVDWLAATTSITISQGMVEQVAFGLAFTVTVYLTNWLGKQTWWQWLNRLISLGLSSTPALYEKTEAAGAEGQPDTAIDMGGEEVPTAEKGAIGVGAVLALFAVVAAFASLLGAGGPWLALGVIALGVAVLLGNAQITT